MLSLRHLWEGYCVELTDGKVDTGVGGKEKELKVWPDGGGGTTWCPRDVSEIKLNLNPGVAF
jgi:hypothetical protein